MQAYDDTYGGGGPAPYDPTQGPPYPAPDGKVWHWDGSGYVLVDAATPPVASGTVVNNIPADTGQQAAAVPVSSSGGSGGGGGGYAPPQSPAFNWPTLTLDRFSGTPFKGPDPFTYADFKPPTLAEAQNEPGYAFAAKEGADRLENSAAARGVLRTGGTLKDILAWGNKFGEQNYGNVYNRGLTTYGTNRTNAAENYMTNYGVSRDVWDRNTQLSLDTFDRNNAATIAEFNPKFRAAELTFADLYNRWKATGDWTTTVAGYGA